MMQVCYEDPSLSNDDDQGVFARFFFNGGAIRKDISGRDFETGLRQLGGDPVCEVWRSDIESAATTVDGVRMVASSQYLLASATADSDELRADSHDIYLRLLKLAAQKGFPNIVRTWNSVPEINIGEGDDERYKQFCVGRSEAFDASGRADEPPPAATAVGSIEPGPLRIFVLAGRSTPKLLENPRQVSAYRYPRKYGPRSPAFSRAAMIEGGEHLQVFLSGTAAITGHETRHVGDASRQIVETLENIRHLVVSAGLARPHAVLRIYLRDPAMREQTQAYLEETFTHPPQIVFLAAELCRRELLIEIDGILHIAA